MKNMTRREVCVTLPALAAIGTGAPQALALQQKPAAASTPPAPAAGAGTLGPAHAIAYEAMPVRTMANGGESRDIAHGTLATGETVNLHQSMQVAEAAPNPLHVIQHTEFILVREGILEFQHEFAEGKIVTERVGPGGAFYVAFGTNHTVKNVGGVPARYFVVAIGGDAK
jgi:mannose-6-phosphate isomerase-like protein (cupin superfamily)